MDTSLANAIVGASTTAVQQQISSAVQVNMLKKTLDNKAATATQLLQAIPPVPSTTLASSGPLGTQVNTYA